MRYVSYADSVEDPAPVITGHISTGTDEDNKQIYDALITGGLTPAGAAGLMGNFMAECGMNSENLQNSGNKKLDMTDAEYTSYVDNGTYTNFAKDGHGYGLAQWTYHTRKAALLAFAKQMAKSIGDFKMQVAFTLQELKSFPKVLKVLQTTTSVKEASDIVLTQFERPAVIINGTEAEKEAAKDKRAAYGQKFYDQFAVAKQPAQDPAPALPKKDVAGAAAAVIADLRKAGYTNHEIYQIGKAVKNGVYDAYIDDMAKLVIAGKYGNGQERKEKLAAEGHPWTEIQARVNKLLS